jgi:hypothetical protein
VTGNVDRSARLTNQRCESGDILFSVKAGVTFGGSETWSSTLDSVTLPELALAAMAMWESLCVNWRAERLFNR